MIFLQYMSFIAFDVIFITSDPNDDVDIKVSYHGTNNKATESIP